MSVAAIQAKNLTRLYHGRMAIENVSFVVHAHQIAAFLGPNGAGKSTTLRILTGLTPATSGQAFIQGCSVARCSDSIYHLLGYLPEHNPLPDDLRVEEYLYMRAKMKGVSKNHLKQSVSDVLELCDLNKKAKNALIGNLSKGYKQRVGIAEAIIHQPKVLILDEPTVGLDPHQVIKFKQLMLTLKKSMTILVSSHLLEQMEAICDQAIIIHQGHVIAAGSPHELKEQFFDQQVFRIQFFGDCALFEQSVAHLLDEWTWKIVNQQTNAPYTYKLFVDTKDNHLSHQLLQGLSCIHDLRIVDFQSKPFTLEHIFLKATPNHWEQNRRTHA